MIEETEARWRILEATPVGNNAERVSLGESLGRIAAADFLGRVDLPGFDNSSMDGYAVRAVEAGAGARLRLAGEQPAGLDRKLTLKTGEAIRIFTGAPVPSGADAVVMQEDVRAGDSEIEIIDGVEPGENIRPRGGDICAGQRIVHAGEKLTPGRIGLLASQGYAEVSVFARPRVAIVTTGDELIEPSSEFSPEHLKPGQIYNSNGPMLGALVRQFGGEPCPFHARDEAGELRSVLQVAIESSEFVIIAGGVSVGERDLVKAELAALGIDAGFWRVRVKPGKPFLFGHRSDGSLPLIFGLPGNPVSAFVTFLLFSAPALARYQGASGLNPEDLPLGKISRPVAELLTNFGDRPHYVRVKIGSDGAFRPTGLQQSHAVFGLSRADALIRLNPDETLEAGSMATGYRL